jgi:pilus assembly protein CpaE
MDDDILGPALTREFSSENLGDLTLHHAFTAFVDDDETAMEVKALSDETWPGAPIHRGGLSIALAALELNEQSRTRPPKIIVVDVSNTPDPAEQAKHLVDRTNGKTIIVGMGIINDVGLYRDLVAAGFSDYLVKPITKQRLQKSILEARNRSRDSMTPTDEENTIITVIGARGGVGGTTVALNLAYAFSEKASLNTALFDLDVYYGKVALAMDLEPSPGLHDALMNPGRIDSLLVTSALVKKNNLLHIMAAEEPLDSYLIVQPEAIETLLNEMRERFDVTLIDLPRTAMSIQDTIINRSDIIMLI